MFVSCFLYLGISIVPPEALYCPRLMSSTSPEDRATLRRWTQSRVEPNLKLLDPEALVETVPPRKAVCSVGSGGYIRPSFFAVLSNSSRVTAGWTTAIFFCLSRVMILLSFSVARTQPPKGMQPPVVPVSPPEMVIGTFFAAHSLSASTTSFSSPGR